MRTWDSCERTAAGLAILGPRGKKAISEGLQMQNPEAQKIGRLAKLPSVCESVGSGRALLERMAAAGDAAVQHAASFKTWGGAKTACQWGCLGIKQSNDGLRVTSNKQKRPLLLTPAAAKFHA